MQKTLVICESTKSGADAKIILSLISVGNLLPTGYEIRTTEDKNLRKNGSIEDVKDFITNGLSDYSIGKFKNVLIIGDADNKLTKRFNEIKKCFNGQHQHFELPQSKSDTLPNSQNKINVNIYLLPNNKDKGGLETLCLKALKSKKWQEKLSCVKFYMSCLSRKRIDPGLTENNKDKAKFRVYHATPNPDGYVHDLLNAIDIDSASFDDLKAFIRQANR